uniref:CL1 n=1 Tax=Rhizophora mucronata TaxID=61149 RepID=A0A2P2KRG2_RHIMU
MAAMRLIFSQGRLRHHLTKSSSQLRTSSLPSWLCRSLSSDSNPNPSTTSTDPNPNPAEPPRRQSVAIDLVSYAVKPKDETPTSENETPSMQNAQSPQQEQPQQPPRMPTRSSWTRADIRFVKDVPPISPISYPTRVAPLPEDRAAGEGERTTAPEEGLEESEEMKRQRRLIEAQSKKVYSIAVEEKKKELVPFPRLIMPKKEMKEKKPLYDLTKAIKQVKANAKKTFDESVEAHVRLNIEKSRTDLIVRGTFTVPHGGKKALRVAFFAEGADADEARAAGADIVGGSELIDEIANAGKIGFDKCYTTRQMYQKLAKIAKILNRHGLMPDTKRGTVVTNITEAVKEGKKNQVKFRMDKTSIVHVALGKVLLNWCDTHI